MCRLRSLPVLAVLVSVVALPARAEEHRLDRLGDPLPDGAVARLGTNRLRHPHGALGITFSPDGKTLFTAGYGAVLHHWDVTTGKQVGTLDVPVGPLRSVDFTRDGKTMLTSTLFGDAHFALDAETGKVRREFGRRPDPNAVGIGGERDGVRNTALSPDGNILVRAARTLRQWDLRTGTTSDLPIQADKVQEGSVPWDYAVAFAADGGQLAVVEEDGVLLVEAVSGKKIRRFALTGGVCVALSPDGKTLAVGVTDGTVRLWAVDTGKEVQTLRHHSSAVRGLLFGPDGRSLYASAYAGIGCWEAGDGRWPMRWAVAAPTAAIALSRDGQVLASVGGLGAVFLWDAVSGKERLPLDRHTSSVSAVAFSPNGRTLASASSDTLLLWDVPGSRLRREFAAVDGAHSLAFSPDGRLLAAGHETQPPRLLEAGTGKLVRRFEQQGMSPSGVSFSPDGTLLASADTFSIFNLWDTRSGESRGRFGEPANPLNPPSFHVFSPDGKTLVAGGSGVRVRSGPPQDPRRMAPLMDFSQEQAAAFSPDGRLLALAKQNIKLIDWATGVVKRTLMVPLGGVHGVVFSPDGRMLLAAHREQSVYFWEVATGKLRLVCGGRSDQVRCMSLSPDGRTLASGGDDGMILLWEVFPKPARAGKVRAPDELWQDLASPDAEVAFRSICDLLADPAAVSFLKARLRTMPRVDPQILNRLLADLDSDDFSTREKAERRLAEVAEAVEAELRQAHDGAMSLEVRLRIGRILEGVSEDRPSADQLRQLRALEVLEVSGTPEAKQVLEALAGGAVSSRFTQEAGKAVARLGGRNKGTP